MTNANRSLYYAHAFSGTGDAGMIAYWKNERHFPIIGWGKKLLPSDRPKYSDMTGQVEVDPASIQVTRFSSLG